MARKPLEGIKVLDFCWVVVGPLTTKYLAEYGATVVRIESSKRPEVLRKAAPFRDSIPGINRSGYFANYNTDKYGVTINMGHPRARELVLRMATWADIVTENFTPGTMESWGLGYEELRRIRPDIIMFSTSMLGRGGPFDQQPGFGPVLSSLVGLTYITGWPDRGPVNPYGAYTDFIVPRFAVAAILSAVDYRRRTGKGMYLDMSQLETSLHFLAPIVIDYSVNGRIQERMGNKHPSAAPHGAYPCRGEDRWITIACFSDQEWHTLCQVMGNPSWACQQCFSTLLGRKAHEDVLDEKLGEWTKGCDSEELMQTLQAAGVPAGVVEDCRDLFEDCQLKHRGHFQYVEHPEIGQYATDRSEMNLSKTPGRIERAAPLIGQHNEYILKELIGLSDEEYQSLKADGVLE